ncbi:hypothetical protein JCM3770_000034 [Rhodotorula araucariae]
MGVGDWSYSTRKVQCCGKQWALPSGLNFPLWRRWLITLASCMLTLFVSSVSTSYASTSAAMGHDLHASSYVFGCAIAPMLLAPVSETFGRYRLMTATTWIWAVCLLPQALAPNIAVVILFRFIAGCAAAGGSTLVGGTVADLWTAEERALPMALFTLSAFLGTGLGPAYGGAITEKWGWRWLYWFQLILCGVFSLFFTLATEETRVAEPSQDPLRKRILDCFSRPCLLLMRERIVLALATWVGFSWGIMYLSLEAVSGVLVEVYGFSLTRVGLAFLCASAGGLIAFSFLLPQNKLYRAYQARLGPEARLFIALPGSVLLPGGILLFAFAQGARAPVVAPLFGVVLLFSGISMIYSAVTAYLADAFEAHASSALAGVSLVRNLGGTALPLFMPAAYDKLGYQWASVIAAAAGCVMAPMPWLLMLYGRRLRGAGSAGSGSASARDGRGPGRATQESR